MPIMARCDIIASILYQPHAKINRAILYKIHFNDLMISNINAVLSKGGFGMSKKINLNTEKTFKALQQSDANGLYVPLCVKRVITSLDGKTLPLGEAVKKIQKETCKKVRINPTREFILIQVRTYYGLRVVKFHSKRKNPAKKAVLA